MVPLERLLAGHDFTGAKDARAVEHPDIADTSNGPGNISERGEILGANKERGEKRKKKMGLGYVLGGRGGNRGWNVPPDAEMLPRSGTYGMMSSRSRAASCSSSSQRTAEWPRMSELMRTRIAPRTHDSGILVAASGSDSGRAGSGPREDVTDGNTPVWWCCRRACPRPMVSFVRVSAVVGRWTRRPW